MALKLRTHASMDIGFRETYTTQVLLARRMDSGDHSTKLWTLIEDAAVSNVFCQLLAISLDENYLLAVIYVDAGLQQLLTFIS